MPDPGGELFRGHAMTALLEPQSGVDAARTTLDTFSSPR